MTHQEPHSLSHQLFVYTNAGRHDDIKITVFVFAFLWILILIDSFGENTFYFATLPITFRLIEKLFFIGEKKMSE
jgi:hypothetical protein